MPELDVKDDGAHGAQKEMQVSTIEERLRELLDQKDQELDELREEVRELENSVESSESGWSLPRESPDDHPELPLPRLEMAWTPMGSEGREWGTFICEYRLVIKHLCDHLVVIPLGRTKTNSGSGKSPFERGAIEHELPFRDGCHAHHDAAHLGLPFYALTPSGPVRLDGTGHYEHQAKMGRDHRRDA